MNYVFIITNWLGGGVERVFENVAKALHENRVNTNIYLFVLNGFDLKVYPKLDYVNLVNSYKELRQISKNKKNTLVINFTGCWRSGIVARSLTKNYVSWVHMNPYSLRKAKSGFINFYILKHSKKIIYVCDEQRNIMINEFGFKNENRMIYNPIDNKKIQELGNEKLTGVDYKYFLMTARIDFTSKDFYTVVDAYENLEQQLKQNYKLVFLGDGPDRKKLENYIEAKKLQNSIVLTGYDPNPYKWMKNAECNILSSTNEGSSLSVIEAMSLNCPLILTEYHTGSMEVSANGKNTCLVKIGDYMAMSQAMKKIVSDNEYKNSLLQNCSSFVKQFYYDEYSKKINEFFDSMKL